MSNIARKVQHFPTPQKKSSIRPVKKNARISVGEKILWTVFIVLVLVFSILIIHKSIELYNVNAKNVELKNEITILKSENKNLKADVVGLSSYERIVEIAKENGLTIQEGNVKSLGE